jgi:uncharacterized protein (DUF2267 family)
MTQTASGLDVFERTLHKTNIWLKHLMQILATDDRHAAYLGLRATLHALRDRITVEEVAQLGAQLPMLIRGFYYEGWDPTGKPLKIRHRDEFLARITQELRDGNGIDAERVASAVFTVLAARVADGEIEDVKQVLPGDIRDLWP